jgi:hypothetical protein
LIFLHSCTWIAETKRFASYSHCIVSFTYLLSPFVCTGIAAEFTIAALDSFMNRRPGGEDISVIMDDLESSSDIPRAGKVMDNSDGTYTVTYSITVSSTYHLSITFNSVLAAGSPHRLAVLAQEADVSLTYAYGNFRSVMTGRTHTIFVQTRDRYGNFISTDPDESPEGSDQVILEYCTTVGETCVGKDACVCADGEANPDVAIQVSPLVSWLVFGPFSLDKSLQVTYAKGPNGTTVDGTASGKKYFGLYEITYFPYTDEAHVPLVRHNDEYIKCYFDMGESPVGLPDPVEEADKCVRVRTTVCARLCACLCLVVAAHSQSP